MAITFRQSTGARLLTAASTWSQQIVASTQAAGSLLVVGVTSPNSSGVTVSTITDSVGNVYLRAARSTEIEIQRGELWYAANISSGSTRISYTLSGLSSGNVMWAEFVGVSTGTPLLSTGNEVITVNSTEHFFSQITPSEANTLIVTVYGLSASTFVPATAGADNLFFENATRKQIGVYSIQTAASTTSGYWRTDAATSTGRLQHGLAYAVFSDTFAAGPGPDFLWSPNMLLLGTM